MHTMYKSGLAFSQSKLLLEGELKMIIGADAFLLKHVQTAVAFYRDPKHKALEDKASIYCFCIDQSLLDLFHCLYYILNHRFRS